MSVLENLQVLVGEELGVSAWMEVSQERIDRFADATDDHQWIHVDPVRAAAGPFGGTIAHGFLTLALVVPLLTGLPLPVPEPRLTINYGLNRVRFITPVPAGGRVRARATLTAAEDVGQGIQVERSVAVELEGAARPALVAETVTRLVY